MPRRGTIERRIPPPDARYNSILVQQFINKVMQRGKKSTAEKIVYQALELAADRLKRRRWKCSRLRSADWPIGLCPSRSYPSTC